MPEREVETRTGRISWEQTGTGPDLVFLHSLLTDRHAFDAVLPALSDRYRLNLVDLPGFGRSTPVMGDIDAYADAVGAFLVAAELQPGRTSLIGNGLGAFVALGTAIRHGDRFHRLCLVGCGVAFPAAARDTFAAMAAAVEAGGMAAVVDIAVERIFPRAFLDEHPAAGEQRRRVLNETHPDAFVTACRALQRLDYREEAGSVANATWLMVGEEDTATPPPMAEEAHRLIPSSRLMALPGLGHAPHLQDPGRFSAALEEFLADT